MAAIHPSAPVVGALRWIESCSSPSSASVYLCKKCLKMSHFLFQYLITTEEVEAVVVEPAAVAVSADPVEPALWVQACLELLPGLVQWEAAKLYP
jgi:hypothetical protein